MSGCPDHGGDIFAAARRLGTDTARIIDFSASINPLGMSLLARQAVMDSLDSLVHYPDIGQERLKLAIAAHHGVPMEAVTVANGSTDLIHRLPSLLSGSKAMIVAPAFSEYSNALEQHGWEVLSFTLSPADGFSLDVARLRRDLEKGVDALFLCNPGNPSGILYPPGVVSEVIDACCQSGTFLVLDEAFMDFCEESSAKHAVITSGNGVVLRSMTKFFGIPGLRLGYALAEQSLSVRLRGRGGPWGVNTLAAVAGIASLQDRDYIGSTRAYVAEERSFLSASLSSISGVNVYPSAANYLLAELTGNTMDAATLAADLSRRGILIRDCSNFTGLSSCFFRVAVRTRDEDVRLLGEVENILAEKRQHADVS